MLQQLVDNYENVYISIGGKYYDKSPVPNYIKISQMIPKFLNGVSNLVIIVDSFENAQDIELQKEYIKNDSRCTFYFMNVVINEDTIDMLHNILYNRLEYTTNNTWICNYVNPHKIKLHKILYNSKYEKMKHITYSWFGHIHNLYFADKLYPVKYISLFNDVNINKYFTYKEYGKRMDIDLLRIMEKNMVSFCRV